MHHSRPRRIPPGLLAVMLRYFRPQSSQLMDPVTWFPQCPALMPAWLTLRIPASNFMTEHSRTTSLQSAATQTPIWRITSIPLHDLELLLFIRHILTSPLLSALLVHRSEVNEASTGRLTQVCMGSNIYLVHRLIPVPRCYTPRLCVSKLVVRTSLLHIVHTLCFFVCYFLCSRTTSRSR